MAKPQVTLMLDSGALIAAGKGRKVESIVRRWREADAQFLIGTPSLAEAIRDGPTDAAANRLIKTIDQVAATTEAIARSAGALLGQARSDKTIDAIIVATADHCHATDILTSDPDDMRLFAGGRINILSL